jgi:NAD(P)-dependent dehydrogenase (short-subunit alcohol dehydrogenase family)
MVMTTQTVIITGASRGLGATTARLTAQLGANVVLVARSADELTAVAQGIQSAGGRAQAVAGDVSQPADCQRVAAATVEAFGQVDALVNCASVLTPLSPIADGEPEAWEESWAVNVLGPVLMVQAALPYLRQRQGTVINISSGAVVSVIPGWAAYCTAKAALNHFTRALAAEEPSITTIAFRPGVVDAAIRASMRREGTDKVPGEIDARLLGYDDEDELPPEVPGCALAVLALYAPHEWSGSFLPWNHEEIQSLVRRFGCLPGMHQR